MNKRKNIQVIDGADNCTYDIYSSDETDFNLIFPGEGQDIEFIEDFTSRVGENVAADTLNRLWQYRENKKNIHGIHGTLFFEMDLKKPFYPTKREAEMIVVLNLNG